MRFICAHMLCMGLLGWTLGRIWLSGCVKSFRWRFAVAPRLPHPVLQSWARAVACAFSCRGGGGRGGGKAARADTLCRAGWLFSFFLTW